ncbi:MAG: hypothetical protein J6Y20_03660 [Lachnospiraceae bacterium]|nr:hypothetical protein [Lachnospiraceae bacterium]
MANSLLSLLGGSSSAGSAIIMQAVGAALRGESPQAFMKRLANQHPQLKRMNLDDLQGTAQQLCQQHGVDPDEVARSLDGVIEPMIRK